MGHPPPGQGDDPVIDEEAARAEIGRLANLPAAELAIEVMDAFGADGPGRANDLPGLTQEEITGWLLRDYACGQRLRPLLRSAVRRACRVLAQAGMVKRGSRGYAVSSSGEVDRPVEVLTPTAKGASALSRDGVAPMVLRFAMSTVRAATGDPDPRVPWPDDSPLWGDSDVGDDPPWDVSRRGDS